MIRLLRLLCTLLGHKWIFQGQGGIEPDVFPVYICIRCGLYCQKHESGVETLC